MMDMPCIALAFVLLSNAIAQLVRPDYSRRNRLYLQRELQSTIPISDPTHHDRKLEAFVISTTNEGQLGGRGVMFDIKTTTDAKVRITSFLFHSNSVDLCNVQVFTKQGTHRSFEENSAAWTNIVDTTMECKGPQAYSSITSSMFDPLVSDELIIEPYIGRAIYIDTSNILRYSRTYSEDEIFAEDSYLQILEGSGLTQKYGDIHSPRMWNGVLAYELVAPVITPQLPVCEGFLTTPSIVSESYDYNQMFDIISDYPGGILIDGIEFHIRKTESLSYEIYLETKEVVPQAPCFNVDGRCFNSIAGESITGGGEGDATLIVRSNFTPIFIEDYSSQRFLIKLDKPVLRNADIDNDPRFVEISDYQIFGDIFAQNDHISIAVGEVVHSPYTQPYRQFVGRVFYRTVNECPIGSSPSTVPPTSPPPLINLALFKPAEQDSVEFGGVASRAVDGNTDGNFNMLSVTHTESGSDHYWMVNLEVNAVIFSVILYNRADFRYRLNDFTLEILDAEEFVVDSRYFTTDESSEIFASKVFSFSKAKGSKVRITMESGVLSLAEVEVYGYAVMVTSSPTPIPFLPTSVPTTLPTTSPTSVPTTSPTATPTVVTTATPTNAPTATITVSNEPTATPSSTLSPTKTSFVTTATPTDAPIATITESNEPTTTPSTTLSPTQTSSSQPSKTASLLPSSVPSSKHIFQSSEPSESPFATPIIFSPKAKKTKKSNKAEKSTKSTKSKLLKTKKAKKSGKSTKLIKSKWLKTN